MKLFENQNRGIYWLSGGLVVINILCLVIIWTLIYKSQPVSVRDKHHDRKDPMVMLKEELLLNEDQVKKFESERQNYFNQIDSLIPDLNKLRAELIEKLTSSESDSTEPDELIRKVGVLEANLEEIRLIHFKNLYYICTKEQQAKFTGILKKLMSKKPPSDKPEHKDGRR
jgi:Spy/CpxP family protein refolding chaperone